MRAAVTGATGLLGSNLAIELIDQGHEVRATRRATSGVDHLDGRPVDWVEGDLADRDALTEAFSGCDVVFHCAALISVRSRLDRELVDANVGGTANVLAATRRAGAGRLVHVSTTAAVGVTDDGSPCTEESRWNMPERGLADGYAVTKRLAEQLVLDAAEAGAVDAVVANPSYMIGPYDAKVSSGRFVTEIVRHRVPVVMPGFNNFVDVRDVARGLVLAATKGRCGERYILAGENLSYADAARRVAAVAGVRAPGRLLPRPLGMLGARVGDLYERAFQAEALVNSTTMSYVYCPDFRFSSAKAERELGYAHGPIEPAIADAIAYFRARGVLPAA